MGHQSSRSASHCGKRPQCSYCSTVCPGNQLLSFAVLGILPEHHILFRKFPAAV
jgi:hypothetical protein